MPAKSPKAAADTLVETLRRAVACVTDRPLLATGFRPSYRLYAASFVPGSKPALVPTLLGQRLGHVVRCDFLVTPLLNSGDQYDAHLAAYWYQLLNRDGQELLAYHWHPTGVSPVTIPHVHVSNAEWTITPEGRASRVPSLSNLHLTSGHVALSDVVRLLITELGVLPRRSDWDEVLRANRDVPPLER